MFVYNKMEPPAHVEEKSKTVTIFKVFDRLIKTSFQRERACAALIDFLKSNPEDIGSTSSALYSAKRLIRGLSSQEPEKQGLFFTVLCTTLSTGVVSATDAVEVLQNVVENTGNAKAEQQSINITCTLAYGAIIVSGKLEDLPNDEATKAIEKLATISSGGHYIKSAACSFLIEATNKSSKSLGENTILPVIARVTAAGKIGDAFLAFTTAAYLKFTKPMQKFINEKYGGRNKFLETVLMRGHNFPANLQDEIVKMICLDASLSGKADQILRYWAKICEGEVKSKLWTVYFLGFARVLLDVIPEASALPKCLPPKLIDVILRALHAHGKKNSQEHTYIRAKDFLVNLTTRVAAEEGKSTIALALVKQVVNHPSGLLFDRKTKTNTVQLLIGCLSSDDALLLADELVTLIKQKTGKAPGKDTKDIPLVMNMITRILTNPELRKRPLEACKYLELIFDMCFLKSTTTSDVKAKITDAFFKAIELSNIKLEDKAQVLSGLVNRAQSSWSDLAVKLKEESVEQWKNMLTTIQKMEKKSSDEKFIAVRVLLLQMGLFMFRDEDLASSSIKELLQCYQRLRDKKDRKKASNETEPHWVEVTVDLLLSMLSHENRLLRQVVSSVFPNIAPFLTATALQQIIDALDPASRNDVLKHIDSDDSDDESGQEGGDSDENNDFDDEEDEESAGSEMDDEEETVNDKLRMAVRNALGYSAALTDDESVDMDEMNEDEEKRLNESLSNAFRLFRPSKGNKKKQSKDDEALMHFRIRVLDLVEMVLMHTPSLSSCLELIDPLFALLEFSIKEQHQKQLQIRLESVMKKFALVKKFNNDTQATYSEVLSAFKRLFEKDTSGMVCVEMAASITEASSLLIRASQVVASENESDTIEKFIEKLLDRFFIQSDRKIPFSMFQHTIRLLWDGNWQLSQHIMSLLLNASIKKYKKIQLLELLEDFYKNDRLQASATDDRKKNACTTESKFVKKFAKLLNEQVSQKGNKMLPSLYSRLVPFIHVVLQARNKFMKNCTPEPAWHLIVSHLLENISLLQQQKASNKLIYLAQRLELPIPSKEELKALKRSARESIESEESEEEQPEDEIPSKKRKTGGDAKKIKKQSREKRALVSSEGIEDVVFSAVNPSSLQEEDEPAVKKSRKSSTEDTPKKKKSKK